MLSLVRSRQVTVTVSIQSAAEAALPVETARLAGLGFRGSGFRVWGLEVFPVHVLSLLLY